MSILRSLASFALAASLFVAACDRQESGPLRVSAIGGPPKLANPNLEPLDAPSAFLLEATAQGLVRFDPSGQIEPALAQSWIVSDDGLRYTFRLANVEWTSGGKVTADHVVQRLRAASSRASRNALKPLLGAIAEIEAMTDDVLEISLVGPRPNFLQLLAQPELAIVRNGAGTGPFRAAPQADGAILLSMHRPDEEDEGIEAHPPDILLRGEPAAMALARFRQGRSDLVNGGTAGHLPLLRAADVAAEALRIDPVSGLLGLAFVRADGPWADPAARAALAMSVDKAAIVTALAIPDLQPRDTIVPLGIEELPNPALPAWAGNPQPMRRETAAQAIAGLAGGNRPVVRVELPDGPGYRIVFAHLRRDWRAIGVDARLARRGERPDLRLVDSVAPVGLASWYLRHFTCDASALCSSEADLQLREARIAATAADRQARLAAADRLLTDLAVYIPITAPVRWSLVSARLDGVQPNAFARRFPGSLIRIER